jgi:hypothetical protein
MKPTRGYSSPGCHFRLRDNSTRPTPALRPIAEARVEAPDVVGWPPHRPREQVGDPVLEHLVGGQADRVLKALRLQVLVHVGQGEGRIAAQQASDGPATIPRDHRIEHVAPAVLTVDVAPPQGAPFQVAVLVEHKERMVAGALEVAVVRGAFLRAVRRAQADALARYLGQLGLERRTREPDVAALLAALRSGPRNPEPYDE